MVFFLFSVIIRLTFYFIPYLLIHGIMNAVESNTFYNSLIHSALYSLISVVMIMTFDENFNLLREIGWMSVLLTIPVSYMSSCLTYTAFHRIYKLPLE